MATTRRPSPPASPSTSPTLRSCSCCWCGRRPTRSRRAEPFGGYETFITKMCLHRPPFGREARHTARASGAWNAKASRHRAGPARLPGDRPRADLQILGRRPQGRNRRRRTVASVGAGLPAGRPHAGHRAARPHADRRRRTASCRRRCRRAEGLRRPARAACTTSCSTATSRRTRRSISASPSPRAAARAPRWRVRAARRRQARRRQGDLPSGRAAVERQSFRLPHRADARTTICS